MLSVLPTAIYLKRPNFAAKLLDHNTTNSFWLRMRQMERATFAIRKLWYESFGKNIGGWVRLFRAREKIDYVARHIAVYISGNSDKETDFHMTNHFQLMHLLILIGDAGQSQLSNQGAVPLHRFALNIK